MESLERQILEVLIERHPMTVRGVFYRLVGRGVVEKTENEVDRVGRRIAKMREEGRLDWSWIIDGHRSVNVPTTWEHPGEVFDYFGEHFRLDPWEDQDELVEVWCEKDTLTGILAPVTHHYAVPLMVSHGMSSITFVHDAAEIKATGKRATIFQLGDRDKSGEDAWNAIQGGFERYAPRTAFTFQRLAVTDEQIQEYDLPTRPSKSPNDRADSVEIDAMDPETITEILTDAIESVIDADAWNRTMERQAAMRAEFAELSRYRADAEP